MIIRASLAGLCNNANYGQSYFKEYSLLFCHKGILIWKGCYGEVYSVMETPGATASVIKIIKTADKNLTNVIQEIETLKKLTNNGV